MTEVISASNLSKKYGEFAAIEDLSFTVSKGQILGIVGPNGAGKTTLLRAIMGLSNCTAGQLRVLGVEPTANRCKLMQKLTFIADVATLPQWMTVAQAVEFVAGVQPHFDRAKAESFLQKTRIKLDAKVQTLSKGMVVQAHLALIMAIDAEILILDEPTLGLDIVYRKEFYQSLINDYYTENRTIIITTHQVEEVEDILTDIMMIDEGKKIFESSMESFSDRFVKVVSSSDTAEALAKMNPISEQSAFGVKQFIFENADRAALEKLGKVETVGVADVFVAKVKDRRNA
jgi:ABC-2 type transport system ATP-binding protein